MTNTDTNTQVEGHLNDIYDLLDAFCTDETISLADYADGLADLLTTISASYNAARHDLSQGKG